MAKSVFEVLNEKQRYFFKGKEKEYEQCIAENLQDICEHIGLPKIKKIIRQPRYNLDGFSIKPDIFVIHEDGTESVFEVKCSNAKYPGSAVGEQCRAIGQLLLYRSVIKAINKGNSPRMFLVDQKIHKRTVYMFSDMKLPVTLIEVQNDRVFIPYMRHEN